MKFLKALFPGADEGTKIIEKGFDLFDKVFYTDQEKAEDARKAKSALVGEYLQWLQATSGQNRARRALALLVAALWAFTWILALLLDIAAPWVPGSISMELRESSDAVKDAAGDITPIFMLVMTFYFTLRPVSGAIEAWKAKHTKPEGKSIERS